MVQEVQTPAWYVNESTLETIEAVGTSSRKILEWRQTRWGRNVSRCEATGNVSYQYRQGQTPKDSEYIESDNITITDTFGDKDFSIVSNRICLPVIWWYSCELTRWIGPSIWTWTIYVNVGDTTVYTNTLSANSETVTFTFNAGKFDKLTIWWEFSYTWSSTAASITFSPQPTLKIQSI